MNRLRAYLQLMRFPAVFTVIADVLLAFLITQPDREIVFSSLLTMLVVSSNFYLAGMVFNDVFDRKIDAIERPDRPIPSGRVTLPAAVCLGCVLLLTGWLLLASLGMFSLQLGFLLVACILLYDGVFNKNIVGPVLMGACRLLNLLMVASAHQEVTTWIELWSTPLKDIAIAIGIYILGLTLFAQFESGPTGQAESSNRNPQAPLILAAILIFIGLAGIGVSAYQNRALSALSSFPVLLGYGLLLAAIGFHLRNAMAAPSNELVQTAVKNMLQSIVIIDAIVILLITGQTAAAIITLALIIPARLLGRWIFIT